MIFHTSNFCTGLKKDSSFLMKRKCKFYDLWILVKFSLVLLAILHFQHTNTCRVEMQAGMHGVTFLIVRNMINNVPFRLQNQIHAQLYESCLF